MALMEENGWLGYGLKPMELMLRRSIKRLTETAEEEGGMKFEQLVI